MSCVIFADRMIQTSDFDYYLPADRIADRPLANRSDSRLLTYKEGEIQHHAFKELPDQLPKDSLLVFNDTKVLPARLLFRNPTGAIIEVFLLKPLHGDYAQALGCTGTVSWECLIGNKKKWKPEHRLELQLEELQLVASLTDGGIQLDWLPSQLTFAEVIERTGKIPLPPYLNRESTAEDKNRYQTIYAQEAGAVAAPTAGLHFTSEILSELSKKGISKATLTLHVGAGTFLPVKSEDATQHRMHSEFFRVSRETIESLTRHNGPIIAVGTTSMRTLESLYWIGHHLMVGGNLPDGLDQEYAYSAHETTANRKNILNRLVAHLETNRISHVEGSTSIFIRPGYEMRICNGLITNFHQPKSTLLMLVQALIGDEWKRVYHEALAKNYRFLSYGDSSLLIPKQKLNG